MREIKYGDKLIRRAVFLRLFHVCLLSVLVSLFSWILLWSSFFPDSHMDIGYWVLAPCVLCYTIQWQAKREPHMYFCFQKERVSMYWYPKHVYWFFLRKQKPRKKCISYQDIQTARLTYQRGERRSHREYELCLHLTTIEKEYQLPLKPAYLSKEAMQSLLVLLSTQITNFQDPYHLQLCVVKQIDIDTYLHAMQERGRLHEDK